MCSVCGFSRCPGRCPNAPEPPVYGECYECGEKIYDGDEYYDLGGNKFCEACVRGSYRTAEVED